MRFHICNCAESVFDEVEACLIGALRRMNHEVTSQTGIVVADDEIINIALAAFQDPDGHLLTAKQLIIYNFEQIGAEIITPIRQSYFRNMRKAFVWDYSAAQIQTLRVAGIDRACHVPFADSPDLLFGVRPPVVDEDIDVLFYGALTARRLRVIEALRARGITVTYPDESNNKGVARNALVARTKVLLNIGTFDNVHTLEMVRLAPWFAMGKAVVSEIRPDTHWDRALEGAFLPAPLDGLVDACIALLNDAQGRKNLGRRAQEIFSQRQFDDSVAAGVSAYLAARDVARPLRVMSGTVAPPRWLRYDCTEAWIPSALNVSSVDDGHDPDAVFDFSRPLAADTVIDLWRFGRTTLQQNYFERILCKCAFTTAATAFATVNNFARLLKPRGELTVMLPYAVSYAAAVPRNGVMRAVAHVDAHFFALWQSPRSNAHGYALLALVGSTIEHGQRVSAHDASDKTISFRFVKR